MEVTPLISKSTWEMKTSTSTSKRNGTDGKEDTSRKNKEDFHCITIYYLLYNYVICTPPVDNQLPIGF